MKNIIFLSSKPVFDIEEKDKIEFCFSEDRKVLKIKTTCYSGAKSHENEIILHCNEVTEGLFKALSETLVKT